MTERTARETVGWSVKPAEDSGDPGRILVIDQEDGRSNMHVEALARLGLKSEIVHTTGEAIDRLAADGEFRSVLIDATVPSRGGKSFATEIAERFGGRDIRTVVVADKDSLDLAFDSLEQAPVELMCRPLTEADYRSVLGMESRRSGGVRETSSVAAPRLAELSNEVGRIARALASLVEVDRGGAGATILQMPVPGVERPEAEPTEDRKITAGYVRSIIKSRRARDQFFSAELFADPAWDILLDLMAARMEHKRVSVSSLCIAAAVPATTALRWIKSMSDAEMLVRRADPLDGRRVFIDLSDEAAAAMEAYLSATMKAPVS